jgi:hypothetical protein
MVSKCIRCGEFGRINNPKNLQFPHLCLYPDRLILFISNSGVIQPAIYRGGKDRHYLSGTPRKVKLELNNRKIIWAGYDQLQPSLHNTDYVENGVKKGKFVAKKSYNCHKVSQFVPIHLYALHIGDEFYLFRNGARHVIEGFYFGEVKSVTPVDGREFKLDENFKVWVKKDRLQVTGYGLQEVV